MSGCVDFHFVVVVIFSKMGYYSKNWAVEWFYSECRDFCPIGAFAAYWGRQSDKKRQTSL
jgi:hypothetical protein